MASAFPEDEIVEYNNNNVKHRDPSEVFENGGFEDTDEALSAEFRHRIGILEEDADLTEAFKASIGMLSGEGNMGVEEIVWRMDEERDMTISRFKFSKFVKENFQKGNTGEWTNEPIKSPLLSLKNEIDKMASVAVFLAIQRFMGDAKSPPGSKDKPRGKTPIMTKLFRTLESYERGRRTSTGSTGNEESFKIKKRSSWKKVFKRSNSERESEVKQSGRRKSAGIGEEFIYSPDVNEMLTLLPRDELDLIHYIIGHAILRKDLRDEVLCLVCKQLTNNPSKESELRGWRLLSMCCSCFIPGEELRKYFRCFLKDCPLDYKEYAGHARRMMSRIQMTGMRYHPPNWMEYEATKLRKYVMLPVSFADRHIETIEVDSATTAGEMCAKLAQNVGLKDDFGFSIFITIYDKVSSLGSGYDHVMDAISECEQVVRGKGHEENEARWRLYLRKEVFSPWHDPGADPLATNFIFRQICRGIRSEEYRCRSEEDLVKFAAQKIFIENNGLLIPGKIQQDLLKALPKNVVTDGNRSRDSWTQAIMAYIQERGYVEKKTPIERIKQSIVFTAMRRWPLQFSGLFEAYKLSGPRLPKNDLVLAVNCKGVFILEDPYKITVAYPYFEIVEVITTKSQKHKGQSFSLITIKGDEYTFISPNAETIVRLVTKFLEGLRQRSIYCIGLQDYTLQGEGIAAAFSFKQGSFIEILDEEPPNKKSDWVVGRCDAMGTQGPFPLESVYIIPTLEKPPPEFVYMFQGMSQKEYSTLPKQKKGGVMLGKDTIGRHKKYGLDSAA